MGKLDAECVEEILDQTEGQGIAAQAKITGSRRIDRGIRKHKYGCAAGRGSPSKNAALTRGTSRDQPADVLKRAPMPAPRS